MKPHTIGRQMLSLLALAGILLLVGCDHFSHYDYRIKNDTGETLRVFVAKHYRKGIDSFVVAPAVDTVICVGEVRAKAYDFEDEEFLTTISSLDIYKNDTIKAPTNLLKTDRWEYAKLTNELGSYTLTITDADF